MLRCASAFFLFLFIPPSALSAPQLPQGYQRPDFNRHAVNAVIGDLSFAAAYGALPAPDADPDLRVRTHLAFVRALLSARDTSDLSDELRAARRHNLDNLAQYVREGVFPRNSRFSDESHPCFIDGNGRICAVGYLVQESWGRPAAEAINARYRDAFLWNIDMPELNEWVAQSGLSLLELSMIQPQYAPRFNIAVTQDDDAAPATVRLQGYVRDEGCCCGIGSLLFDFGHDAIWVSPLANQYQFNVDISWTYQQNGIYTVTGYAIAPDWCGSLSGTRQWTIVVGPQFIETTAVVSPTGPPYDTYLTTPDDIRPKQWTAASVDWGDGVTSAADWTLDGSVYRTSVHAYAGEGPRTIVASITYATGPAVTGTTTAMIGHSLATEVTTWGRIKALYR